MVEFAVIAAVVLGFGLLSRRVESTVLTPEKRRVIELPTRGATPFKGEPAGGAHNLESERAWGC